jgi:hypothetical protein
VITTKTLVFLLLGLMVSGITGVGLLVGLTQVNRKQVLLEITKSLLTLIMVGVVGNVLALIASSYERYRRMRDAEREAKTGFLARLDKSYRALKTIRRMLKAKALTTEGGPQPEAIRLKTYDIYMREMEETQLDLETLINEIEGNLIVLEAKNQIRSDLVAMERFLRSVTHEYETILPTVTGPTLRVGDLIVLSNFLGPYRDSAMRVEFMHRYKSARELLVRELSPK